MKTLLACLMLISISACASGDSCTWSRAITPDAGFESRWTVGEKRQVVAHNLKVKKFCR